MLNDERRTPMKRALFSRKLPTTAALERMQVDPDTGEAIGV